ncbi:hypothetical protein ACIP6I_03585 [Streptomyces anulatus]
MLAPLPMAPATGGCGLVAGRGEDGHRSWQRDWQRLVDQRRTRRSRSGPNSRIGSWDGAADAVLVHSSAQEFAVWPQGRGRLDELSRAVASLGAA